MTNEEWQAIRRHSAFFKVQTCPSVSSWEVGRNNAYGYNYKYLGSFRDNADPANPYAPFEAYPIRQVRSPAATIAFADCDGTGWTKEWGPEKPRGDENPNRLGNHGYLLDPTYVSIWAHGTLSGGTIEPYAWKNWRSYLSDRHLGRSQAIFADGHGEAVTPARAYRDNSMWNGLGIDPGLREDGTQDTSHGLYRRDPHIAQKWDASSGQEWRYPETL
jgi:prepilin-type processing-associated H-X9-DG protein